jgi:hypothetical protein
MKGVLSGFTRAGTRCIGRVLNPGKIGISAGKGQDAKIVDGKCIQGTQKAEYPD